MTGSPDDRRLTDERFESSDAKSELERAK